MPPLTITKTYVNEQLLYQVDFDHIVDPITTFLNTTLLDSTNVQVGGLTGTNLANSTLTSTQLSASSVGTAQLASSSVTTSAFGPLAVAIPQLAPFNSSASDSCSFHSITNTTLTQVINLSVTMNFSGVRPVFMSLMPASSTGLPFQLGPCQYGWAKNGTTIATCTYEGYGSAFGLFAQLPFVDQTPSAGSNTYSFQTAASSAVSPAIIQHAKIFVWEPG